MRQNTRFYTADLGRHLTWAMRLLLISALVLGFSKSSLAAGWRPYTQGGIVYQLYAPDTSGSASTKFPMIVWLHGNGGQGNNNTVYNNPFPQLLASSKVQSTNPCFILVPQCPIDSCWVKICWGPDVYSTTTVPITKPMQDVIAAIDSRIAAFPRIDTNRINMTGGSMGGYGTWDAICRYPDKFASGMPVSGSGDTAKAAALAHLPIWAIAHQRDEVCPVAGSDNMVAALRTAGGNPRYSRSTSLTTTAYGHHLWDQCWDSTQADYFEPNLVPWIFAQSKAKPMAPFILASAKHGTVDISMTFSDTLSSGTITSHAWNFGDGSTATGSRVTHTYTSAGTYTVKLKIGNGSVYDSTTMTLTVLTKANTPLKSIGTPFASIYPQTGWWSSSLETIRNGYYPINSDNAYWTALGTYNMGSHTQDYVGYMFPEDFRFTRVVLYYGVVEGGRGGAFASPKIQVRQGGSWVDVAAQVIVPAYVLASVNSNTSYAFTFTPIVGDGIRVAGAPGDGYSIACAELDVEGTSPSNGIAAAVAMQRTNKLLSVNSGAVSIDFTVGAQIAGTGSSELRIADMRGRTVFSSPISSHHMTLPKRGMACGLYLVSIVSGSRVVASEKLNLF